MGLSRKLRRGDVVRIGDATITCVTGSGLRVQIDAPRHVKIDHKVRQSLTRKLKCRKLRPE